MVAVDEVLWKVWDSIGVNHVSEARRVFLVCRGIVRLLYSGASDLDLMLCHAKLETEAMGHQFGIREVSWGRPFR